MRRCTIISFYVLISVSRDFFIPPIFLNILTKPLKATILQRTEPGVKKPEAALKTKRSETSPKSAVREPQSRSIDKISGTVSGKKVPANQLEPSTDEDDLIMM